jgi:uncharacterized membrane protein YgcG
VAGTAASPYWSPPAANSLAVLGAYVVDAPYPTPIATVLLSVGPGVERVRLTVPGAGGGTDEMAPKQQLAILAHGVSPSSLSPSPAIVGAASGSGVVQPGPAIALYPNTIQAGYGLPAGTKVEALGAGGKVLETIDLPNSLAPSPAIGCAVPASPPPAPAPGSSSPPTPAPGSGTTGSGTTGNGTTSSGSGSGTSSSGSGTSSSGGSVTSGTPSGG